MKPFLFIVSDHYIQEALNASYRTKHVVTYFKFSALTPNGYVWEREIIYPVYIEPYSSLKLILTELVIKHTAAWYRKYTEEMPVRIEKLNVWEYGAWSKKKQNELQKNEN